MKKIIVGTLCVMLLWSFAEAQAQDNKLVIWSHWKGDPIKMNFMQAVAAEFEKAAGIKVEIVWLTKNELKDKFALAFGSPEPDLTYVDYEFTHPRLSGPLLDLSALKFSGQLDTMWSLGSVGEGKNNFLPFEGASSAMYYNKALFAKAGIVTPQDRPVTDQEFLDIIKKLRAAGITPVGEGVADRQWKGTYPIVNAIFRFAGPEKLVQLTKGAINFADPDVVKALTFWKQVVEAHAYDNEKALKLSLSEGIWEMTDGKAALSFCGTWIYSKFGATERDKGQVGVLDWFTAANGKGNDFYDMAWVAGYGINRNSQRLEAAQKFLAFLMTPAAANLYVKHVQGPYPVAAAELAAETLYSSLTALRSQKKPVNIALAPLDFGSKAANNMWLQETQKFITGAQTVEGFIEQMNSRLQAK